MGGVLGGYLCKYPLNSSDAILLRYTSVPPQLEITHFSVIYAFSCSIQLVLVDLVESSVFFLACTLTSVSLTVTQFILLPVDSLLEALLHVHAELLLRHFHVFSLSTCTFHTFSLAKHIYMWNKCHWVYILMITLVVLCYMWFVLRKPYRMNWRFMLL